MFYPLYQQVKQGRGRIVTLRKIPTLYSPSCRETVFSATRA
jgi:hypothetical protein